MRKERQKSWQEYCRESRKASGSSSEAREDVCIYIYICMYIYCVYI